MRWNSEKILSLSALVISLATLITLIYQSKIMREHEENSSFPKLELWNNNFDKKYQLELRNTGLGPAIIESIKIVFEDSVYDLGPAQFARNYMDTLSKKYQRSTTTVSAGKIIEPGQRVFPVSLAKDSIDPNPTIQIFNKEKARVIIWYSSVYHQQWQLSGIGEIPQLLNEKPKVIDQMLKF